MLGIWETLLILGFLGWMAYNYISQRKAQRIDAAKGSTEEIIDLEEGSYEILDEDT